MNPQYKVWLSTYKLCPPIVTSSVNHWSSYFSYCSPGIFHIVIKNIRLYPTNKCGDKYSWQKSEFGVYRVMGIFSEFCNDAPIKSTPQLLVLFASLKISTHKEINMVLIYLQSVDKSRKSTMVLECCHIQIGDQVYHSYSPCNKLKKKWLF